jgi:hypothetical protein
VILGQIKGVLAASAPGDRLGDVVALDVVRSLKTTPIHERRVTSVNVVAG